jgi:hypothetical protein
MNFEALSINIQPEHEQWWITLFSFENEYGSRSLLHIEHTRGLWKFQLLWIKRDCWVF